MEEDARLQLTRDYPARMGIEANGAETHAVLHMIVENQIALGDETPVQLKARQLMAQGLDGHEATHAIASALMGHLQRALQDPDGQARRQPLLCRVTQAERPEVAAVR